jgi:hypothetical protein
MLPPASLAAWHAAQCSSHQHHHVAHTIAYTPSPTSLQWNRTMSEDKAAAGCSHHKCCNTDCHSTAIHLPLTDAGVPSSNQRRQKLCLSLCDARCLLHEPPTCACQSSPQMTCMPLSTHRQALKLHCSRELTESIAAQGWII